MNTLECSSRGDRRFSAFYAKVDVFGKPASIEEHYQLSKVFLSKPKPMSDRGIIGVKRQFSTVKEVKDFQKKGNEPKEFRLNDTFYPVQYLSSWYKLLWVKYLDKHPELVDFASQFEDFTDMFRGKSINCQADVIRQYVKTGRASVMHDCRDFLCLLKCSNESFKSDIENDLTEVENYFWEQYKKASFRVVPGHWPEFKAKPRLITGSPEIMTR